MWRAGAETVPAHLLPQKERDKLYTLDSSIFKTPQVFLQNPFYFLPSEVY